MSLRDPEELLQEALEEVTEPGGTAYRCSQSDIDATGVFTRHNRHPLVSAIQASQELIEHNDPTRSTPYDEQEAIRRLASASNETRSGFWFWSPDLIIKCFFDLDIVFFGGVLRGNACARWAAAKDCDGDELGFTVSSGPGRASIRLNAEAIFSKPVATSSFRAMFSTMFHEMCVSITDLRLRFLVSGLGCADSGRTARL